MLMHKLFGIVLYVVYVFSPVISCGHLLCMSRAGQWESFWAQGCDVKEAAVRCYLHIDKKQKRLDDLAKKIQKKDIFGGKNLFCDESCGYVLVSGHVPTIDVNIVKEEGYELIDLLVGPDAEFLREFLKDTQTPLKSYIRNIIASIRDTERSFLNTILRTRTKKYDFLSFNKDFPIATEDLLSYALSLRDIIDAIFYDGGRNFSPEAIKAFARYRKDLSSFLIKADRAKDIFFQYLRELDMSYLQFFRTSGFDSVNGALLNNAMFQINTVLSLGERDNRSSLNVTLDLITLFQNEVFNEYVRPFTHTEHMWAYLLLKKASTENEVIASIRKKMNSCGNKDKVIIGTKMDMCDGCEALICDVAKKLGKELLVVSISEHVQSGSFSRSGNDGVVKKIPVDSELSIKEGKEEVERLWSGLLRYCREDIQTDPEMKEIRTTLQTIFSVRMLALLGPGNDIIKPELLKMAGEFVETPSVKLVPEILNMSDIIMNLISLHCCFFYTAFVDKKVARLVNIKMGFRSNEDVLSAFDQYLAICSNGNADFRRKVEKLYTKRREEIRKKWMEIVAKIKRNLSVIELERYQRMGAIFVLWNSLVENKKLLKVGMD